MNPRNVDGLKLCRALGPTMCRLAEERPPEIRHTCICTRSMCNCDYYVRMSARLRAVYPELATSIPPVPIPPPDEKIWIVDNRGQYEHATGDHPCGRIVQRDRMRVLPERNVTSLLLHWAHPEVRGVAIAALARGLGVIAFACETERVQYMHAPYVPVIKVPRQLLLSAIPVLQAAGFSACVRSMTEGQ